MKAVWLVPVFLLGAGAGAGGMKLVPASTESIKDEGLSNSNNGWGDLAQRAEFGCGEVIRVTRSLMSEGRSTAREEKAFGFITKGDEDALVRECGVALGPGLGRCAEYSPGSERAIDCARRYMSAAINEFMLVKCLQGIGVAVQLSMTPSQVNETLMNMDRAGKRPAEFMECVAAFGGAGH